MIISAGKQKKKYEISDLLDCLTLEDGTDTFPETSVRN
jgi:hypothetical protein